MGESGAQCARDPIRNKNNRIYWGSCLSVESHMSVSRVFTFFDTVSGKNYVGSNFGAQTDFI